MKKTLIAAAISLSFNAQADDLLGVMLTDKSQINEIHEVSANSFAYHPSSIQDLKDALDLNDGRYHPVIVPDTLFRNEATGMFEVKNAAEIKQAIDGRNITWLFDEWMWKVRMACDAGSYEACADVASGYEQTQRVAMEVKHTFTHQIIHIEAYQELINHLAVDGHPKVQVLTAADVVGFDCYGAWENCNGYTIMQYGEQVYNAMLPHQKMMLVPGTFSYDSEAVVIDTLNAYIDIYEMFRPIMRGIGVFIWGDFSEDGYGSFAGLGNMQNVKQILKLRFEGLSQ